VFRYQHLSISAETLAHLKELHGQLKLWLLRDALPLWDMHGVDRSRGGYFESVAFDPVRQAFEAHGEIRRGRVVARQIFVFHTARSLGWEASGADPLLHGCEYLFAHMKRDDGHFHTGVEAGSRAPNGAFSLYESAFYLFALAKLHGTLADVYPVYATASTFLELLRAGWGKANGGFDESRPASLPLKSNPHMHLLEAALAWIDATEEMPLEQPAWLSLAAEMVELALNRFMDPRSGAVREFFDESWAPMAGDSGRIVEPGHQFEWAWLLLQWAECRHCSAAHAQACRRMASRLMEVGERCGVDAVRGVAVNELWDDMTPKDASAKLWPQTERVKAWCAVLQDCRPEARDSASRSLSTAIRGLRRYLEIEPMGLWREVLFADGTFSREPSKASSFYHIVCAIETLDQCMASLQS
jgi:mannose/cellobiose epimerase-like protein (N-acyl-D-glucosamine 2-epimerase family)